MTTVLQMVNRVRRQLDSGHRNEYNRLGAAINSSTQSVVLEFTPNANVEVGDIFNVDLEVMRVVAYNSGTRTATVVRGYLDSTAASHADEAELLINPRFSMLDAFTALVDEINSWGPQLYRVVSDEFTVAAGTDVLELPAAWINAYGLVGVYRRWDDDSQDANYSWPRLDVRLQRATTDWSVAAPNSGLLLRFVEASPPALCSSSQRFALRSLGCDDIDRSRDGPLRPDRVPRLPRARREAAARAGRRVGSARTRPAGRFCGARRRRRSARACLA